MGFDAKKYLRKTASVSRKIANIQDQELYEVHRKGGKIIGIAPTQELELLTLQGGFGKIRRSERCTISGETLEFLRFSFNFIPNDSAVCRIRIDKEGLDGNLPHVNPDPRLERKYGGHRLYYPKNTALNIDHFCLLYFIILTLWYQAHRIYPLEPDATKDINECVDKKQVEK